MTPSRRWSLVALVAVVLAALPFAPRLLPVDDTDVSAADLLDDVRASAGQPYAGYVETAGTVQLAVGSDFDDVGALLGERTRLRVWWRSEAAWRVDRLLVSGETDLVHGPGVTTSYDYQDAKAVTSRDPEVRLPRTADLVPPTLARTTLAGIAADEVSRLPARRVAGIAAPGLRVEPAAPQTTIDHVDLWADPGTGLPLRVDVYGDGASEPDFTTQFREIEAGDPGADRVSFGNPEGVDRDFERTLDIADAANQYAPFVPPDDAAGLERTGGEGAVGVYGRGVTRFVAIPLRESEGDPLREQLLATPGRVETARGVAVAVGPLTLLLAGDPDREGDWLLAGTVTVDALDQAAADVRDGFIDLREFE